MVSMISNNKYTDVCAYRFVDIPQHISNGCSLTVGSEPW